MPLALAVVFFSCDMPRGTILSRANTGPLLIRHHPIGFRMIFSLVNVVLLFVHATGFPLIQLAPADTLGNRADTRRPITMMSSSRP